MKNLEKVESGLPPDAEVVLDEDYDDPPLAHAVHAAWAGDWTPVARLLEADRVSGDWELRAGHVGEVAEAALDEDRWLHAWLAAVPNDPNALVVLGDHLLNKAWESRGARYAADTTDEQAKGFYHYLGQVEPVVRSAAAADPADPTPWGLMLTLAMGSPGGRRELYDEAWSHVMRLDPFNRYAHAAALQYSCEKWHGSNEGMFAFAYGASDTAPQGSPLHTLPLKAWLEYDVRAEGDTINLPGCREAVNRALTVCPPGVPAAYRWDRADRNLLTRALFAQDRYAEAYAQFQALGDHATSFPWNRYSGTDARDHFLEFRSATVLKVAEEMP